MRVGRSRKTGGRRRGMGGKGWTGGRLGEERIDLSCTKVSQILTPLLVSHTVRLLASKISGTDPKRTTGTTE